MDDHHRGRNTWSPRFLGLSARTVWKLLGRLRLDFLQTGCPGTLCCCEQHFSCSTHLLGYNVIQRPTVFQEFQDYPTAKKTFCKYTLQRSALQQIPRHPATMGNSPVVQPLPRSLALMEVQCEPSNWMCLVLCYVYSLCSISLEIGPT